MSHTGPILEGRGNSDYERYVRVEELLELQKPLDQLVNPEELLFQTTHQTAELWLRQVDYEVHRAGQKIEQDHLPPATDLLRRCRLIIDLVQTGSTLKANGLVETEIIAEVTSRLIVNRTALKTQPEAIGAWIARFRAALEPG